MTAPKQAPSAGFSIASSIADDVRHPPSNPSAYEWWYFDALSDDASEAVVVIFLDNFIFSPHYNRQAQNSQLSSRKTPAAKSPESEDVGSRSQNQPLVPAVAFVYYRNGKPVYRAINELPPENFFADESVPHAEIGESNFKFESAPYGSGYSLSIKANLPRRRRLEARLEWLSLESDLLPANGNEFQATDAHRWNLVAPRSDVTGSIKVFDSRDKILDVRHFRGTGYHDHNLDSRWLPATVNCWQWGRAHFPEETAIFYRYCELNCQTPLTKLLLVKNNELQIFDALYEESKKSLSVFGLRFPKRITLRTENGIELQIEQQRAMDESFFYLRFLSEAELKPPAAETAQSFAITEHLAPRALKYRWLDWLVNMRIGRGGKGSFL